MGPLAKRPKRSPDRLAAFKICLRSIVVAVGELVVKHREFIALTAVIGTGGFAAQAFNSVSEGSCSD
jgi:hypothetical protein